jgi:O-antigen/teichoic acid export membrane protein
MGIVFRQSAKNLVVVVNGAIMGAVIIWLSTKYNSKEQLGSIRTLTNYAVILSQILLFGFNNTLAVFVHRYANNGNKKKLLLTLCLAIPIIIAALFTIGYYCLHDRIIHHYQPADQPFMERYFMWLPVYTVFFIYMIILEQYLGAQLKVAVSAFMREVVLRAANIVLLLLFGFGYIDFNALVVGTIITYIIPLLVFIALSLKTKDFGISFRFSDFSRSEYKDIIHFSWYHFLLTVSIIMMGSMDVLLIPFYDHKGFSAVAVYSVAIFFTSFIQLPFKALVPASFAVLAKAFADDDLEQAKDIFTRASVNILIPTIGIGLLLCCNLQNAVAVIKNGYSDIIPVFLILVSGIIISISAGMNDQVLSVTNYYKFNFYLSLIIMVVLFLMLRILIPRYGIYGAAVSSATALAVSSAIKSFFVWKKLGIQPYSGKTLLIFICGLPALACGYFFPYFFEPSRHVYVHSFMDATMRSTVIVIIYVGMLLWLKPSKDLEEYILSIRKNKRLF